jgi:hypothetical protein
MDFPLPPVSSERTEEASDANQRVTSNFIRLVAIIHQNEKAFRFDRA